MKKITETTDNLFLMLLILLILGAAFGFVLGIIYIKLNPSF